MRQAKLPCLFIITHFAQTTVSQKSSLLVLNGLFCLEVSLRITYSTFWNRLPQKLDSVQWDGCEDYTVFSKSCCTELVVSPLHKIYLIWMQDVQKSLFLISVTALVPSHKVLRMNSISSRNCFSRQDLQQVKPNSSSRNLETMFLMQNQNCYSTLMLHSQYECSHIFLKRLTSVPAL